MVKSRCYVTTHYVEGRKGFKASMYKALDRFDEAIIEVISCIDASGAPRTGHVLRVTYKRNYRNYWDFSTPRVTFLCLNGIFLSSVYKRQTNPFVI